MTMCIRPFLASSLCVAGLALASVAPATAQDYSREEIEQIVYDYLMENPEVILEAVRALEQRQQAEQAAAQRESLAALREDVVNGPSVVIAGNPSGDVTLVEFFDYRCGYCKRVAPAVMTLVDDDPGLRMAMIEFPILGDESVYAARAALAARAQGGYWAMHEAMIEYGGTFDEASIRAIAGEVGLDPDRLLADMGSPDIDAVINRNYELANALGINGTPAFIIGDQIVPGAVSLEALQDMIAQARQG